MRCADVKMSRDVGRCANLDAQMRRCEDEQRCRCENVDAQMRRCEDEQTCRCADVKMSRDVDVQM